MQYQRVRIKALGYALPTEVISSAEIEERILPVYQKLGVAPGQIEARTGIKERRFWPAGMSVSAGATQAALRALEEAGMSGSDLDLVLYTGVCRDYIEPATACSVAAAIGVKSRAVVHDLSNACLGMLSGMIDCANRIELGQIRAGLVVACESARDIYEDTIARLLARPELEHYRASFATFTGGSGAVAVLLTDGSLGDKSHEHQLLGAVQRNAVAQHQLCRWSFDRRANGDYEQLMRTDAAGVLRHGIELAMQTWESFRMEIPWAKPGVDKAIGHQVGTVHRQAILNALGLTDDQDYASFPWLGNIGSVSVPLTAALAAENNFLQAGQQVGLLGIGSGLSCLMLGVEW